MKKILLIGGTGGLGKQIELILKTEYECISVGSKNCDVTNEENVINVLNKTKPDIIIYLSVKNIDGLIHKQTNEDVTKQLNVNLIGFLNVLRNCTQNMRIRFR